MKSIEATKCSRKLNMSMERSVSNLCPRSHLIIQVHQLNIPCIGFSDIHINFLLYQISQPPAPWSMRPSATEVRRPPVPLSKAHSRLGNHNIETQFLVLIPCIGLGIGYK